MLSKSSLVSGPVRHVVALSLLVIVLLNRPSLACANDEFDLKLSEVLFPQSQGSRRLFPSSSEIPSYAQSARAPFPGAPIEGDWAGPTHSKRTIAQIQRRRRLVGEMDTTSWVLTGVFAVGGAAILTYGSTQEVEDLGDIFQVFLPASAMGMTWIGRDGRGAGQFALQLGTGTAVTLALKKLVSKRTPTAASENSFPSGHTQAAFSGASFIFRRYGPRWGVPAMVLASFTGLSRLKAERHYLDDVIAGMSIALVGNWTFVHPIEERVSLNPLLVNGGFGVGLTVAGSSSFRSIRE